MASAATVTSCSLLLQFRNPKPISQKHLTRSSYSNRFSQRLSFYPRRVDAVQEFTVRDSHLPFVTACAISPDVGVAVVPTEGDNSVTSFTSKDGKIKLRIDISGAKSEEIFENTFSKMVAAAQPIPGFRRVKGEHVMQSINIRKKICNDTRKDGKKIPRDILIEILGPSKVYKQVIKKIINSILAEYVKKENLKVTNNVKVEQSFEELEATFELGKEFNFDAVLELRETDTRS